MGYFVIEATSVRDELSYMSTNDVNVGAEVRNILPELDHSTAETYMAC